MLYKFISLMLSHIGFWLVYLRFVCPLSFSHFLLFTPLQTYLCKQRNSSTNMDPFSFHFISGLVRLGSLDQSIPMEPDSTFPVRLLNKLLQLCPTATFHLSFASFSSFRLVFVFLMSLHSSFHLLFIPQTVKWMDFLIFLTNDYYYYSVCTHLTTHQSVIMCLKYIINTVLQA